MSVRFLFARVYPAALVLVGLSALVAAEPRPQTVAKKSDDDKMETRCYAVAELVVPISNTCNEPAPKPAPASEVKKVPDAACGTRASVTPCQSVKTQEDQLIKLIVGTVAPETWSAKGGRGSIVYEPLTMSLVVHQTPTVLEQVAELLKTLRRCQDVEVALEVRFISVSENYFERTDLDCNAIADKEELPRTTATVNEAKPADNLKVTFFNDKQVTQLLERLQGDQCTNVMQAPKLTLFNGQCSNLDVQEARTFLTGATIAQVNGQAVLLPQHDVVSTGLQMNVQPVVSADRKSVRVHLNATLSSLGMPEADLVPVKLEITPKPEANAPAKPVIFTQYIQTPRLNKLTMDRTMTISDGGTALISGWKRLKETRSEFGPPVLSKIPYVNRLFKNVGYGRESECVLVMVTPRIIINEEEKAVTEEQEECCRPKAKASSSCCESNCCKEKEVAELLAKYYKACAEGRRAEATELAVRALALDPACFHKGGKTETLVPVPTGGPK
jgi:type II secretory pathway component GspD/PulD (secretin)